MPATLRTKASGARRREILLAALDCFVISGVEATTIEDIRARSGASVGSIYHHFGSKENLARALYIDELRDYQEGFLRELKRHDDAESGIRAVVAYHLAWISKDAKRARYLLTTREADFMTEAEDAVQEMNRRFFEEVASWRQPHIEAGAILRLPADFFTPLLVGPLHQFSRQWLAGRATSTITEAQSVLADAVWRALKGRDNAAERSRR